MKQLFLFVLFFSNFLVTAQEFEISGRIVDQETGSPLESATIFVEQLADSALVAYTISARDGTFIIEGEDTSDSLRLVTSYNGYLPLSQIIVLKPTVDLGNLSMKVATNELGEVMVVANRAPISVKSDTLEFNAGSFSTRPDANLEDVMKKLPGVDVDAQGNITVNGKPVSRILVNGKEFFGNDPKIATKNLPKEIIDKIQVVNTKSKSEEFTGKVGNPDDKTINITIKEDKNKGYFSRVTAGGGTDERYELSAIGNYFKDDLRVSALASSNNINSAGFSFDEVFDMMGRRAQAISINSNGGFSINGNSFGSSGGITKSETAGFNFTNEWDDKYELGADYFFGRNDTETSSIVERETFLPDDTYFTTSISEGEFQNDSHRANAAFEVEFDTLTRLSVSSSVSINDGFSQSSSEVVTFDADGELTNNSATQNEGEMHNMNFSNRLDFIKRFGSRGAYLQIDFQNENEEEVSESLFFSERNEFEDGQLEDFEERDQFIDEENTSDEYSFGVNQRSVLAEDFFLDLSYSFRTVNAQNERVVYDFNEISGTYSDFNEDLSNSFEVKSRKHIPNAGLNYEGEAWRLGFNVGLLNTSLENENFIAETSFDKDYNNLYLNTNLRYEIKEGASVYLYYNNDTQVPSIRELQPVEDISNPLDVVVGNPNLKPAFSHNLRVGYHNFDWATRSGMSAYASLTMAEDRVVPYTITNEDYFSRTTFTNVDGAFSSYGGASYSKRVQLDSTEINFRLGGNVQYSNDVGFSNEVKYNASRLGFGPSVSLGYNYREMVEINPRYELDYVHRNYDISEDREEEYVNHTLRLEATTYWPKNIVFGNDIAYMSYGSVAPGFDPICMLWNMSLGYKFLDDDATLKVKVYDLLNENVSTRRTTGQNYVQDTQELILEQYIMLSFTYKLSRFGGKDPSRGGGVIMF